MFIDVFLLQRAVDDKTARDLLGDAFKMQLKSEFPISGQELN